MTYCKDLSTNCAVSAFKQSSMPGKCDNTVEMNSSVDFSNPLDSLSLVSVGDGDLERTFAV